MDMFFYVQRIQQRLLWWEEVTGFLHSQPTLLKKEVSLRLELIATRMEQLTSDGALTFSDMEMIISEVHSTLNEGFQICIEGKADCKNDFLLIYLTYSMNA